MRVEPAFRKDLFYENLETRRGVRRDDFRDREGGRASLTDFRSPWFYQGLG